MIDPVVLEARMLYSLPSFVCRTSHFLFKNNKGMEKDVLPVLTSAGGRKYGHRPGGWSQPGCDPQSCFLFLSDLVFGFQRKESSSRPEEGMEQSVGGLVTAPGARPVLGIVLSQEVAGGPRTLCF